jgi:hypothetical protein
MPKTITVLTIPLLIEITQCQTGYMWYADKIGELYQVKEYTRSCYMLLDKRRIVWKTDCLIKTKI